VTILPLNPHQNASPEALLAFLGECRILALRDGRAKLVSISMVVDALDPLAVLEAIFEPNEPHFYAERPATATAIAGAEIAIEFAAHGPTRFAEVQRWMQETLEHTIAVGDVQAPFGGPHFFSAFTFFDEVAPGAAFPPATAFVPRWQVALAGSSTTAVANFWVSPEVELGALALRIWRAHQRFRQFGFREASQSESGERAPWKFSKRESGDYRLAVARGLSGIAAGEFSKIVLARAVDLAADHPLHPLQMLHGLRQRFPDCYAFSFARGRGPSFIGASPERLVRVSQGRVETEALAGSIRRGAGASEDAALASTLLQSEKDVREHREVLDDIVGRWRLLGLVPEFPVLPQVRRLANVQHLHTPVEATLPPGVTLLDVLAAMHPTAAVGGMPRAAALPRIEAIEGFSRGLYAGAIGWLNARGGGEFFVGIRSALVDGATARIFAGAGIVRGSTPDKEFAETELKFSAMRDALTR
jgi:menaquinone-specific isochorismate synthase